MFQIFDCNGRAVGRAIGYKTHATAHAITKRPGRVRTALYTAHHLKPWPVNGIKTLYSIRWIEGARA